MSAVTHPVSRWLMSYPQKGKYPRIWSKHIIQKVLIAWANNRCECCGELGTNTKDPDAENGTVLLHVHHLKWSAKHDATWENLLVCCTGCHTRIHNQKWQPGKEWNPKHGDVPQWLIIRGLLDVEGNPIDESSPTVDAGAISSRGTG